MRRVASAPGKFVLSGEYAVLDGAPAICVAVDRRAVVTIETHGGDHSIVTRAERAVLEGDDPEVGRGIHVASSSRQDI